MYTAVASFLQAKSNNGQWLLRIDDLDTSRCKTEYTRRIIHTLETYGLEWDGAIFYQSTRGDAYRYALSALQEQKLLYPCECSRKDLLGRHARNGVYDGYCLNHPTHPLKETTLRLKLPNKTIGFVDAVQGATEQDLVKHVGDFVMRRKDKVHAYHLAVVLDDAEQGITEVLRGYDLLDSTYRQIFLQQLLGINTPSYAHIPVINGPDGAKLSKQTFADDVLLLPINATLVNVLRHLNLNPPKELALSTPNDILQWGIKHWSLSNITPTPSIYFT